MSKQTEVLEFMKADRRPKTSLFYNFVLKTSDFRKYFSNLRKMIEHKEHLHEANQGNGRRTKLYWYN